MYLRSIRPSYLTLSRPARTQRGRERDQSHLTDTQRAQIDASTSQTLSQINTIIQRLSDEELARSGIRDELTEKKRNKRGLGALGKWAAGGGATARSSEEREEDAKEAGIRDSRKEIILYLRRRLERAGNAQRAMVEVRLEREREKEASVLYLARSAKQRVSGDWGSMNGLAGSQGLRAEELQHEQEAESELSEEQLQLFAKENSTMLKHYTDQLDQVRNAEKSLLEISDLQTTLAANLTEQAENIDLLVQDSYLTEENVDRGNKQLKKASERRSTAQMVFWSTCTLCTTLVIWDLIF